MAGSCGLANETAEPAVPNASDGMSTMHRDLAVALLVVAGAAHLPAQEAGPPPEPPAPTATFPAEIEQVIVDTVVIDKKGNPIAGLTQDDLLVTEDGVPQTIVSFEAIQVPSTPATERPPSLPVSTNVGLARQRGRTFVIVFDDQNLAPERSRDAKAAVASFLTSGVREGDSVTLIATAGDVWWTARMESGRDQLIDILKRLEGRRIPDISPERMTDWEAMRIHVYNDPVVVGHVLRRFEQYGVMRGSQSDSRDTFGGTNVDPVVSVRAAQVYLEARVRTGATLGVLERALNGLTGVRGRKSVILVSEGFIDDPNLEAMRRVHAASRRANAAIYFVNARGLSGMPIEFSAQFGPAPTPQDVGFAFSSNDMIDDGSEALASDSGGFTVKNTNDLGGGIQRIARETEIYYLLGYVSSNTARDGMFRKIEVDLRNGKDLKVRARRGYYAPSADERLAPEPPPGVDPVFQATLDSPWVEDAIPIRMTHYVGEEKMLGRAGVVIAAEVDIRGLELEKRDDRYVGAIEFVLLVAHGESGEYFRYDQRIDLDLRESTRERMKWLWFPITREFELVPGDHLAKLVVREISTRRVGSVVHEFEVPPLQEFRVSTPILTDTRRRDPGPGITPQVLARREFVQGSPLMCQFDVFGAAKDDRGMPRVAQGYEVRRVGGTVHARMAERVIDPTSLGALSRLVTFSLKGASVGDYEMRLTFRDELSGKTLEVREPFRVVARPSTD